MSSKRLNILWTNADPLTSHNMVMMYAINSLTHQWWDEVTVIIWGATAKYVAEDENIQEKIRMAMHVGVKFSACIACAENLGVKKQLEDLGMEVIPWGDPLTRLISSGAPLLTI
ncbi:MAG: DsrE family protein [Clostridiales bacterium]|nr:DsrE family protein [Clostridiales bacterium]